jgi:DNA modification methylase
LLESQLSKSLLGAKRCAARAIQLQMEPLQMKISELRQDDKNLNSGTFRGKQVLSRSIRELGAGRSVLIDRNGKLIAGNKTAEAAADIGMDDVIVVESDGTKLVVVKRTDLDLDTDAKAKELALADNRAGQLGLEWNPDALKDLSSEIDMFPYFNGEELKELTVEAGKVVTPEPPAPKADLAEKLLTQWNIQRGQVWEIPSKTVSGKVHRIMCGDSSDTEDVAKLFRGGEKASLLATDPPYGVAYGVDSGADSAQRFSAIHGDEADGEKLQAFLESVFSTALPFLRDDAAWYIWHAQLTQAFFAAAAASAADLLIHRQIIWAKNRFILGHGDYHWRHELCYYGWRKGNRTRFFGDRAQDTVWEIDRPSAAIAHPTEKPVELFVRPMRFNTLPGEICYEPFSGSGTQFCAAEQEGRRCYGMEIEPKYIAVALERMKDMGLAARLSECKT